MNHKRVFVKYNFNPVAGWHLRKLKNCNKTVVRRHQVTINFYRSVTKYSKQKQTQLLQNEATALKIYSHLSQAICPVSTDNSAVLIQPVGSASTMPPPTLLLDCTDLQQAHGRGSQATRQSDTPRNMEPHLPSP